MSISYKNRDLFENYLHQISLISNVEIKKKNKLIQYYENHSKEIASGVQRREKRLLFESRKENLIQEWQENYNIAWPVYADQTEFFINDQYFYNQPLTLYEVHHIIPLGYDVPNEWWNFAPLLLSDHNLIHGQEVREREKLDSSLFCALFPKSMKIKRRTKTGTAATSFQAYDG